MEYGNGGVYEGQWKAGKKHGKGRVKETRDGEWREGRWVEGENAEGEGRGQTERRG